MVCVLDLSKKSFKKWKYENVKEWKCESAKNVNWAKVKEFKNVKECKYEGVKVKIGDSVHFWKSKRVSKWKSEIVLKKFMCECLTMMQNMCEKIKLWKIERAKVLKRKSWQCESTY